MKSFTIEGFASEHKHTHVSIFDHTAFAELYAQVYYHIKGHEPFAIQIRRAFNRHQRIGLQDEQMTYRGSTIILATADELDPHTNWLEVAVA